ncbi:hypothetical protein MtrunA17_Chr4g0075351 [Medicago truncatula]|uniref:Uncharacterized protein n=1 Tax=Medicago truncatula TaxID=3880 RepID=A0A396IK17_MEDTR|nr:hypothetical protein MtrunA17_Chr4g0075351 [Medicago truncatula]
MLAALGFNQNQNRNIFIAGSNLYRDRSRLAALTSLHPKLNLVSSAKLKPFANSSSEVCYCCHSCFIYFNDVTNLIKLLVTINRCLSSYSIFGIIEDRIILVLLLVF